MAVIRSCTESIGNRSTIIVDADQVIHGTEFSLIVVNP
jgi:hypothetical protein